MGGAAGCALGLLILRVPGTESSTSYETRRLAMHNAGILFVLVAAVVGTSYSQDCLPPTASDLEGVISTIISFGDAAPPTITVSDFNVVCQFFTQQEGLLRGVSAVVQYTCTGHSNCPSGTVVEQIESECGFGTDGVTVVWTNDVEGFTDPSLIRSQTADATLSTTTREDCSACISPELAGFVGATTDSITHCVGKCIIFCDIR